ncbi:MAG: alpha/beta hydrolase [Verrucomicrobiae bacterium]|nr:alpha/beta hydrolase [Verrucomicrobiae bacterium]
MVLGAAHGFGAIPAEWITRLRAAAEIQGWLASQDCQCGVDAVESPDPGTNKVEFVNAQGHTLAARLEWPPHGAKPKAVAIFAHCFTCSKDLPATTRIARALAQRGFAVLRFDFTGLGSSDGDFANTNFSSNVEDLVAAAEHLGKTVGAPSILIGHSLGGAAVIAAAGRIEGIRGIVTIAAPSDPAHVNHLLGADIETIESRGEAEIEIDGRPFTIRKQFLDDIRRQKVLAILRNYRGAILILHSPFDRIVSVQHAAEIFGAAHHPKSFVSLDEADHLLTRPRDSAFAAEMIAAWSNHLFDG